MDYKLKYLKYKQKYIELKNQYGGNDEFWNAIENNDYGKVKQMIINNNKFLELINEDEDEQTNRRP